MAELKTKPTGESVKAFIDAIPDEKRRAECREVMRIMKSVTGAQPRMWGPSIVGYGNYHYKYESGREGDWFVAGFSPRKQSLTIYIMSGFSGHATLMKKLGKCKTGGSCLYIKNLEDIDLAALKALITASVKHISSRYA
jgi:hypothetical protein